MPEDVDKKILSEDQNALYDSIIKDSLCILVNGFSNNISLFGDDSQLSFNFAISLLFTISKEMFIIIFTNYGVADKSKIIDEFCEHLKLKVNETINNRMM